MSASLEISRPAGGYANRLRRFIVRVDGRVVGRLAEGETVTVDVSGGEPHSVRARIDWCVSRPVTIDPPDGTTVRVIIENPPFATLLVPCWVTFGCRNYFQVTVQPPVFGDRTPSGDVHDA